MLAKVGGARPDAEPHLAHARRDQRGVGQNAEPDPHVDALLDQQDHAVDEDQLHVELRVRSEERPEQGTTCNRPNTVGAVTASEPRVRPAPPTSVRRRSSCAPTTRRLASRYCAPAAVRETERVVRFRRRLPRLSSSSATARVIAAGLLRNRRAASAKLERSATATKMARVSRRSTSLLSSGGRGASSTKETGCLTVARAERVSFGLDHSPGGRRRKLEGRDGHDRTDEDHPRGAAMTASQIRPIVLYWDTLSGHSHRVQLLLSLLGLQAQAARLPREEPARPAARDRRRRDGPLRLERDPHLPRAHLRSGAPLAPLRPARRVGDRAAPLGRRRAAQVRGRRRAPGQRLRREARSPARAAARRAEGGISLEPYPNLRAWLSRIEALPGFVPMARTPVGLQAA